MYILLCQHGAGEEEDDAMITASLTKLTFSAKIAASKAIEARLAFEASPTEKNERAMRRAMLKSEDTNVLIWTKQNMVSFR